MLTGIEIGMIVSISTLIIERMYSYLNRAKRSHFKSQCCGATIERDISLPEIEKK